MQRRQEAPGGAGMPEWKESGTRWRAWELERGMGWGRSLAGVEAGDESIREACELNAADGGLDVVVNAAELDGGGIELGDVVDDVAGLGDTIAGLADGADVDEVGALVEEAIGGGPLLDGARDGVAQEDAGDVGVAVEANVGALGGEAVGGVRGIEGVAEVLGAVEGGVDGGEAEEGDGVGEGLEPTDVVFAEVATGPLDDAGGVGLEVVEVDGGVGAVVVVVAHDDLAAELSDALDALCGGGVVADDIAETEEVVDLLRFGVGEDGIQRLDVGVDVTDNGETFWTWHKVRFS